MLYKMTAWLMALPAATAPGRAGSVHPAGWAGSAHLSLQVYHLWPRPRFGKRQSTKPGPTQALAGSHWASTGNVPLTEVPKTLGDKKK